ncbi:MAG: (2Fe-2S)-binding protein [Anaerolineales bacterium]|nr:(2Fe-2S)-binding protein [Anaerolineales bacterium]
MITLMIDDQQIQVREGSTILEAAKEIGIPIPTLCYHEALKPYGACRMCVVELENRRGGQLVPACSYPCEENMVVRTNSERVRRSRRMTLELLMSSAAHVPIIQELAKELGVAEPRFTREADDCILCGLCVRACAEIVQVGAISLINRGIEKEVSSPFHIASNTCIGCGTCVLICPTGAITLDDINGSSEKKHTWKSEYQKLDCWLCSNQIPDSGFIDHSILLATEELAS